MKPWMAPAFSDAARWQKAGLGLAVIALMCLWSLRNAPSPGLTGCLDAPSTCDGRLLSTNTGGAVQEVHPWGFWLRHGDRRVAVVGRVTEARPGDAVFLEAVFRQPGWLELRRIYVTRYRGLRILVSFPALAWVIWVVVRTYRLEPSRLALALRP